MTDIPRWRRRGAASESSHWIPGGQLPRLLLQYSQDVRREILLVYGHLKDKL